MQKQKSWRVILLWIIYLAVSAVGFVMNVQRQDMQAVGMGVVALITPWIVPVVMRLCRLKMTEEIWIIDLLFTFFASLIGSCCLRTRRRSITSAFAWRQTPMTRWICRRRYF